MRFDIRYTTRFTYDADVVESQNDLRACPAVDGRQQLLHYRVTTSPASRVYSYTDYWGTRVDAFGVRGAHDQLEVVAEATVETSRPSLLTVAPRWAELSDPAYRDEHVEYLRPSPHTAWGADVADEAERVRDLVGDDVVSAVLAINRFVGTSVAYSPGATYVGVSTDEVLERREGVCQDFAHLFIAMCRSLGIAARYVSGYLFAVDESQGATTDRDEVEVQTHAWVEVAVPGADWWALDPTNRQEVGVQHIKIGHGRDYDDVAPMRGTYTGPADHDLDVHIRIRKLAQAQQQQ